MSNYENTYNNSNLTDFHKGNRILKQNENCYLNLRGNNLFEESELLFEKIRKEIEHSNKSLEFFLTTNVNPELNQLSKLLEHSHTR